MKKIIKQINTLLAQKTNLKPQDICIYGLSGGQDSIFLFIILLHLKKQWNINIQLLHFHHFWQQKNFFSIQHVWKLAYIFNQPIYIIPSELFLENEKKARLWRHQGFERISDIEKCKKIFTGHTGSDRIETAFWHLIRGTSPQGLLSLKWQTLLIEQTEFFNAPKYIIFQIKIIYFYDLSKQKINNIFKKTKTNFDYKKSKNKKKLTKGYLIKKLTDFQFCASFFCLQKQEKNWTKNKKVTQCWIYQYSNTISFLGFHYSFLQIPSVSKLNSKISKKTKKQTTYSFVIFNISFLIKNNLRPLLLFHRNDVLFFSKKYLLPIMYDPTNQKLRWSRNRLRHQLFPLVRFFFNPNSEYLVNTFLEISVEEQNYIDYVIQKLIKYLLKKQKYSDTSQIKKQFQLLPKAIQRRLLQKIFQSYTNLQPTLLQIEFLIGIIEKF